MVALVVMQCSYHVFMLIRGLGVGRVKKTYRVATFTSPDVL